MADFVAVLKDPWNAPAAGVADEFSSPTACMKLKSAVSITTNATGNAALAVQLGSLSGFHFIAATAVTNDVITAWTSGTGHPDYASMVATYNKYRPVSVGVKVFYTGAEQTTAGLITVSVVDGIGTPTTSNMPTSIAEFADLPNTKTVASASMTEPLCAAAHMFDRPKFMGWTATDWIDFFPTLIIGVTGAQVSASVLRVEVTLNLELLPLMTAFAAHHYTSPVPASEVHMVTGRRLPTSRVASGEAAVIAMGVPTGTKRKSSGTSVSRKKAKTRASNVMMVNYRPKRAAYRKRRTVKRKRKLYRRRR